MATPRDTEEREVRSDDPSLSPEANKLLTEELQEAVGTDKVRVPADAPDVANQSHATHSAGVASLYSNRLLIIVTFLVALVVGAMLALTTDKAWTLLIPVGVHAVGSLLVGARTLKLTTEVEHMAPATAAKLEDEGVADPDGVLSALVSSYAGAEAEAGAADVARSGDNERSTRPDESPAEAAAEQRTAMTPGDTPTSPAGLGSAASALPPWFVFGAMFLSLLAGVVEGGILWLLPALVVPAGLAALLVAAVMDEDDSGHRRGPSPMIVVGVTIVVSVVAMVAVLLVVTDAF